MQCRISNITYDAGHADQPCELIITLDENFSKQEIHEHASDVISSEAGFCRQSFTLDNIR